MANKFKSLFYQLIVLAGLMLSTNLLACAPEESAASQNISPSEYSHFVLIDLTKEQEISNQNQKTRHSHSEEEPDSHHECDCCEFCRCTSCTDCTVCASATLSLLVGGRLDRSVDGRISPLSRIYISQSPTPLYHPPILALIFLA